ncbi:MAG TPA: hypothetical protein VJA21_17655 [Verrucomicrobiae bacterium]
MKTLFCWMSALGLLMAGAGPAPGQTINFRLSVKIIVDPVRGAWPAGVTSEMITNGVAAANAWMAAYWRGYRFQLTEVTAIGGPTQGGVSGPSKWFGVDPRDPLSVWSAFQADARNNALYLRRTDAINFYISKPTDWNTGGAAPFPWETTANNWTVCWGIVNDGAFWLVHETGHYFGLPHTHGGCGCPSTGGCTYMNGYWVGDDNIADTLPEAAGDFCFTNIDLLTLANFNQYFASCTPAQQTLAMNTFSNVMSYHDPPHKDTLISLMTELQLDLHGTYANSDRFPVASGHTRFVSLSGNDGYSGFDSTAPKRTVSNATTASSAAGTDIVLLRPGSYNEQITINRPVTLRAAHSGWATVGKP